MFELFEMIPTMQKCISDILCRERSGSNSWVLNTIQDNPH